MKSLRVKICGITKPEQGQAIAQMGATALGFICVPPSPRYVTPSQIRAIVDALTTPVDRVGVFVDASLDTIADTVAIANLSAIQLHGSESLAFCQQCRDLMPQIELIKAFRVRELATLEEAIAYADQVDTLLLDAYHPQLYGGTGQTLDWHSLQRFQPACPWLLAGGLTPDNVLEAIRLAQPHGVDLSSGVEQVAGDKDLAQVARLFAQLHTLYPSGVR